MNEDFLIRIDGRMEQGDESDSVQLMTRGSFVRRGGSFFISYKESETTGYEGCTTTVKVAKDESKVSMTRFGPAAGQLVVEKGIRHLCHYDTGYGAGRDPQPPHRRGGRGGVQLHPGRRPEHHPQPQSGEDQRQAHRAADLTALYIVIIKGSAGGRALFFGPILPKGVCKGRSV